jgi:hypothetical protein
MCNKGGKLKKKINRKITLPFIIKPTYQECKVKLNIIIPLLVYAYILFFLGFMKAISNKINYKLIKIKPH